MKTHHYVYLILCLVDGTHYIGKRTFYGDSISEDEYLGSGTIQKQKLAKYGEENFIKFVLYEAKTETEAYEVEATYLSAKKVNSIYCNNIMSYGSRSYKKTNKFDYPTSRGNVAEITLNGQTIKRFNVPARRKSKFGRTLAAMLMEEERQKINNSNQNIAPIKYTYVMVSLFLAALVPTIIGLATIKIY